MHSVWKQLQQGKQGFVLPYQALTFSSALQLRQHANDVGELGAVRRNCNGQPARASAWLTEIQPVYERIFNGPGSLRRVFRLHHPRDNGDVLRRR